jgi:sugar lactone lactonase YvrE
MTPWSDRLELGEGARWVDGQLILVDILTGRLLSADSATLRTIAQLDVPLGAVAPVHGSPGTWIAAAGTGVCILIDAGKPDWIATVADRTEMRVNDGAADADGRFWFGIMAYDGTVRRYRADGTLDRIVEIPATQPSSVCLGGGLLHITTAAYGLNPPGPYDGAVFTVPVDVPGFPAAAYRGPR